MNRHARDSVFASLLSHPISLFLAVVALAGFGCEARAGLILGELQSQSGQVSKVYASPTLGIAQSFSYGSDFMLTRLDINLFNTSTTNAGSYTVSLYSGGLSGTQSLLG